MWPQIDRIFQTATDAIDAFERSATASTPDLAVSYVATGQQAVDRLMAMSDTLGADAVEHTRQMEHRTTSNTAVSGWGCALPILWTLSLMSFVLLALAL